MVLGFWLLLFCEDWYSSICTCFNYMQGLLHINHLNFKWHNLNKFSFRWFWRQSAHCWQFFYNFLVFTEKESLNGDMGIILFHFFLPFVYVQLIYFLVGWFIYMWIQTQKSFHRYPYLAVVLNFSQTWALYCLVQFYSVTKDKLEPIKPLPKFLTFKSIVFLTWWQGIVVAFLFSMGFGKGFLAQELKTRIQDYFICIEVVRFF